MSDDYRGQARTDVVLVEEYLNKGDHGAAADYLQGRLQNTHKRGRREENEAWRKSVCPFCREGNNAINMPERKYPGDNDRIPMHPFDPPPTKEWAKCKAASIRARLEAK